MSEEPREEKKPYELALKFARRYGGKVETCPRVPIYGLKDFAVWYTPGVAAVSKAIEERKELSFELTNRWNTVAVVTDGSRVLGLGDVGPEASLPVMEGKCLLFKYLGAVDAFPLPLSCSEPSELVDIVRRIEPGIGGVNLEDIAQPRCFHILETLREGMDVPVWHDDQQGTAAATLAGLLNAVELTGRRPSETKIAFIGAGAANLSNARLAAAAGFDPSNFIMVDSKGILHGDREDIELLEKQNPWKHRWALITNPGKVQGGAAEAMDGADVVVAASKPGPGTLKPGWVRRMSSDPIVFALANPVPEIWPWEAKRAGARVVATGRADFPNQVNNSLVFPSVFRGVLDVRARTITDGMAVAAARSLAAFAQQRGLSEEYIIPEMTEPDLYPSVAADVALEAIREGVARRKASANELFEQAKDMISRARKATRVLLEAGVIERPPGDRIW